MKNVFYGLSSFTAAKAQLPNIKSMNIHELDAFINSDFNNFRNVMLGLEYAMTLFKGAFPELVDDEAMQIIEQDASEYLSTYALLNSEIDSRLKSSSF